MVKTEVWPLKWGTKKDTLIIAVIQHFTRDPDQFSTHKVSDTNIQKEKIKLSLHAAYTWSPTLKIQDNIFF